MKTYLIAALFVIKTFSGICQSNVSFDAMLAQLNSTDSKSNNILLEQFAKSSNQVPIIENGTVVFLAKQKNGQPPKMLSDFNGFMNRRYVSDSALALMTSIPNSDWYYSKYTLANDAAINYQYKYGEEIINDPLNKKSRLIFGSELSFVSMPDHQFSAYLEADESIGKGKIIEENFKSDYFDKDRLIQVYLPPNYDNNKRYPSVYFHDGSIFIEEAKPTIVLDKLIAQKKIKPIIAVFINPEIRGKEYRNDENFGQHIQKELIPYITKKYNTSKDKRAVVGFSRGGLSALYLAHKVEEFSICGAFSPAVHPKDINEFIEELSAFKYEPSNIFISRSEYDKIWQQDAAGLKEHFNAKNKQLEYLELNEGHNIPAWGSILDDMMINFFPNDKK